MDIYLLNDKAEVLNAFKTYKVEVEKHDKFENSKIFAKFPISIHVMPLFT
jgi:hypothetical protein